jgi:uncharacterized protein
MVVGVLEIRLMLHGSASLKDKRSVVRSVVQRTCNKFNAAGAEVGDNDDFGRARIGFVTVANDRAFVNSVLSKILDHVEQMGLAQVIGSDMAIENY